MTHNKETGETSSSVSQTPGQVIHWPVFYELVLWAVTRGKEKAFRKFVMDLVGLQPGESVLDVGCGTGTQALIAKEIVGEAGRVSGIEPSLKMASYARRKAARRSLSVDFQIFLFSVTYLREEQQRPSVFAYTTPFLLRDFSTWPASSSRRLCVFHHRLQPFLLNAYLAL